jgi:O-antigen/teichoic acid export membrane protein
MTEFAGQDTITQLDETLMQVEVRRSWRTLLSDFVTLATGEGAARLIGLVAVLIMARRLGPDGFGIITFGLAVIGWFAIVQDSGTEILNVRDVSRTPQRFRPIAESVLGLRLTMSLLAMAGFAAVVLVASKAALHRNTLLGFVFLLPVLALNLRMMVLGVRGARSVAAGNIAARAVLTVGLVLLVTDRHDLSRVPFLQVAAELAYALVVLGAISRRFGWIRPRFDPSGWKTMLGQSYPLMLNSFARGISLSFDIFLIGVLLGPKEVGIYGAAAKPSMFVMGALGLFTVSFLSAYSSARGEVAFALLQRSLRTALLLTVPAALALSIASGSIVPFLFGQKYASGAAVLAILSWRIPLAAVAAPFPTLLLCGDFQKVMMRNSFLIAAFVLVGDSVAVPLFGIKGAAVVSVLTATAGLLVNYRSAASRNLTVSLATLLSGRPRLTPAERPAGG